jgi:hypothetical protein
VEVTGWAELRDAQDREAIGVAFELFLNARCFEQSSTLTAVKLAVGHMA